MYAADYAHVDLRCHWCMTTDAVPTNWLQLDLHGIDARTPESALPVLPLKFCGLICLRQWIYDLENRLQRFVA